MRMKSILAIFIFFSIVGWGPFSFIFNVSQDVVNNFETITGSKYWIEKTIKEITPQAKNLDTNVLELGLNAYVKAKKLGINTKEVLTLVDYSKPSDERRLWVLDLKNKKVLYNTYVSHGKNSGLTNATSFSNKPQSLKSSLGVFITDASYFGGNGYSLKIKGLERTINDNAYNRSIVFHGARYVSPQIANNGPIGRSWGCFAVSRDIIKPLIDTIKEKTLVVAYYPDKNWLNKSKFVNL